jgi:hypothetical protein
MTLDLSINPDPAIARERLYQDYLHECQVLLVEVSSLAEKLAIYLTQNDQHWYPGHINVDVAEIYDNCCKNNLTIAKNYVLKIFRRRFLVKQPNMVRSSSIRECSVSSNTLSVSPPKRIVRRTT